MDLPLINASMNFLSTIFLVAGFIAIRRRKVRLHKKMMITAFCTSAIFLACYLWYHFTQGHFKFAGEGSVRTIYLLILGPHIILATLMLPMIFMTFFFIFRGQIVKHKRWARITFPVWLYVSVTGVILYFYIYVIYPEHIRRKAKDKPGIEQVEQHAED